MPPSQPGYQPTQPGSFQPPAAPYGAPPAGSSQSNGLAITSLVLGIVGLVTFWACGGGALLGVGAVVLGILGLNKAKEMNDNGKGLAIGGIVTGGLAILAGVMIFLFWFVLADDISTDLENDLQQLEEDFGEINSDPSDGVCDEDRFIQDPDC
jgi:hypothetical protein